MTRAEVEAIAGAMPTGLSSGQAGSSSARNVRRPPPRDWPIEPSLPIAERKPRPPSARHRSASSARSARSLPARRNPRCRRLGKPPPLTRRASLTQHPAERLSPALIQTDALARLRAKQEQIIREIEASGGRTSSVDEAAADDLTKVVTKLKHRLGDNSRSAGMRNV